PPSHPAPTEPPGPPPNHPSNLGVLVSAAQNVLARTAPAQSTPVKGQKPRVNYFISNICLVEYAKRNGTRNRPPRPRRQQARPRHLRALGPHRRGLRRARRQGRTLRRVRRPGRSWHPLLRRVPLPGRGPRPPHRPPPPEGRPPI